MFTENRNQVRDYLTQARSASIQEMLTALDLSRNTVRQALYELGAVEDRSWPRKWSFPDNWEEPAPENQLPLSEMAALKMPSKPMLPLDKTLPTWLSQREGLVREIDKLDAHASHDAYMQSFKTLATVFSELYRNVYRVRNEPDWKEQLGKE